MRLRILKERKRLGKKNRELSRQTLDAMIKAAAHEECDELLRQLINCIWMAHARTRTLALMGLQAEMDPSSVPGEMLELYKILCDYREYRLKERRAGV